MRGVLTPIMDGMKECGKCRKIKPITEFYRYKTGTPKAPCKACSHSRSEAWRKAHLARACALVRAGRKRNLERFKDYHRKMKYGLEYGEFQKRLNEQGGGCAICGETNPTKGRGGFHVDHCKSTGIVRGILCHNCNIGIGNLQHDPEIIRAALKYLT
jgi:hypothetical protein